MWIFNLSTRKRTKICCPRPVRAIFAHKNKILMISNAVEIADIQELEFK
jgi:hypothetical protein